MVDNLLTEYNPEIAEEAAKEFSFDIKSVTPGEWIPRNEMNNYIKKLSPLAREAIAKKVYPTINDNTPLLKDKKNPKEVIEMISQINQITTKGDPYPEYNVLESNNGHIKLQILNNFIDYPDIEEGMMRGLFEMYKILRVHLNTIKLSDKELLMEIKWE